MLSKAQSYVEPSPFGEGHREEATRVNLIFRRAVVVMLITFSPGEDVTRMGDLICHPITSFGHLFMDTFLPVLSCSQEPTRTMLERDFLEEHLCII